MSGNPKQPAGPITVALHGAQGKMGREILAALCRHPLLKLVGAIEKEATGDTLPLPDGRGAIPFSSDVGALLDRTQPQVLVDFSQAEATRAAVRAAIPRRVRLVVGTTGLSQADVEQIDLLCQAHGVGAVVAPNFSLGAVLLMHLANLAAPYFDYAEVLEMHHEEKIDAPSGTALATAQGMAKARGKAFIRPPTHKETLPGTRGGHWEGVTLHSVRLPGFMASQEVIFGSQGQRLSLRHDSLTRETFLPGIILAIQEVVKLDKMVFGLDRLLGLA